MFVWRDTLSDGMLPFTNVNTGYQELPEKQVKEDQNIESLNKQKIFEKIQPIAGLNWFANQKDGQIYELNKKVYCKSLAEYVLPIKFD